MAQAQVTNSHVDGIYSDPMLVRRAGEIAVAIVVSINGSHTVLSMPERLAHELGHALQSGHLPDLGDMTPGLGSPGQPPDTYTNRSGGTA